MMERGVTVPASFRMFPRAFLPALLAPLLLVGCHDSARPEAIWCETGTGPAQVVYPRGICYDKLDDTFFVVDRLSRIQHFDRHGRYLNEWRLPPPHIEGPTGLSVGPDGNVYIPDTHNFRVEVYSPQGKLLRQWGSKGIGPGQFIYPTDVAFDARGNVFVGEYGDHDRIQVFTPEGQFLYTFGSFGRGPGQFMRPEALVIDGDTLYVADACNHRIDVFKTDGTFVRSMGGVGSEPGEFRYPYGMDMDNQGHLIVCEFGNNRVQMIDKETGRSLRIWGGGGHDPGQLAYPWAVAVDRHNRIVVADAGNNRFQVFEF